MNKLSTNKTIKLETLEKRFEKLHSAANNAEVCAKAIVFHASKLAKSSLSSKSEQLKCSAVGTSDVLSWAIHASR